MSPERLFEACTREEVLREWWHPLGNRLTKAANELEEGDRVSYLFSNADGEHTLSIEGKYNEVKVKERLVYTWNWKLAGEGISDAGYLLDVRILPKGNGSRLEVVQENFPDEESVQPHKDGWEAALRVLKRLPGKIVVFLLEDGLQWPYRLMFKPLSGPAGRRD